MGERGLPSWKGSSYVKATRQESKLSSSEGSKPFQYTKCPCGVEVMVKPRKLPEKDSVWPSSCEWISRAGDARQVVTPSSPSPFRIWLEGVVLCGEYSSSESEWKSKTGAARQAVAPTSLILRSRSKFSSKLEKDLGCEVFSDQFESNPNRSGASRLEVMLKMDIFSIC
jgi:hypothetical protein